MTYDASNRLTQIDYPGGKYLSFTYDSSNRRISSVDQLGHSCFILTTLPAGSRA